MSERVTSAFNRNVLEIWRDNGEVVPFCVRRWSWAKESLAVVTKVKVVEFPYGEVDGYFLRSGRVVKYDKCLWCAGNYEWCLVTGENRESGKDG